MKKIAIDARCIFDSGIGVYIREVLTRLAKVNLFEIKVIIHEEQYEHFLKLDIEPVEIVRVDFGRYSFKNLFSLNDIIKDASYYFMPALSVTPIFSKVKKVVVVHDLCPVALWRLFGIKTAFFYWLILGGQILFSSSILCISEFTRTQLLHYFSSFFKSKIKVVYNGLSRRLNGELLAGVRECRVDKPYFLCVGNVKPHKNVINLVNYFVRSSQYCNSHKLVIVGKSEGFRTGVDIPLNTNEKVIFTGFVNDEELTLLYKNAEAYLFPSLYEGFGLPMLEAMSFNLPILASNIPVFNEIAGNTVTYFNPYDFNDFDSKLNELLCNKASDYSDVLSLFTWENSVDKILDVFNK